MATKKTKSMETIPTQKNLIRFERDEKLNVSIWKAYIYPIVAENDEEYFYYSLDLSSVVKESIKGQDIVKSKNCLSFFYVQENNEVLKDIVANYVKESATPNKQFVLVEDKRGELV